MRAIRFTKRFEKDYKRLRGGIYRHVVGKDLPAVLALLAADALLPPRLRDHALVGDYADHRDCHIRPVLIYRKPNDKALELVRLGSHSESEI